MMDIAAAARAVEGRMLGENVRFSGVATDTRVLGQGDLFVALKGERFDGHDFVGLARERGAVAAIVAADQAHALPGNRIAVADPLVALGRLAAHWRAQFTLPVIAIVGSNGKTTVKEMLAAILRARHGTENVLATRGNFNNAIGLPLTILGLRENHAVAVIEVGMNHPGRRRSSLRSRRPTIAVINNAQREHQEFMKSVATWPRSMRRSCERCPAEGIAGPERGRSCTWTCGAQRRVSAPDCASSTSPSTLPRRPQLSMPPATAGETIVFTTPHGDATVRLSRWDCTTYRTRSQRRARRSRSARRCDRRTRSRGVSSLSRGGSYRSLQRGRRRDRRHLQRQSGLGGSGDRRACRGPGAAMARAGRHGRSR
jgi:hypothetical protein